MIQPTITRPMIEPTFVRPMSPISRLVPEAVGRTIETFSRTSRFTPEQKAIFDAAVGVSFTRRRRCVFSPTTLAEAPFA
jgi:hypothetical protein